MSYTQETIGYIVKINPETIIIKWTKDMNPVWGSTNLYTTAVYQEVNTNDVVENERQHISIGATVHYLISLSPAYDPQMMFTNLIARTTIRIAP